jgi:dTDP-4-amino-4,6-dideoxygalactose transaminase
MNKASTKKHTKPELPSWPIWGKEETESVLGVLRSGRWWAGAPAAHAGENVWEFQKEFAAFQESKHCVAISNGTAAIEIALTGLGIGLGDEVIIPDYTFVASASAVIAVNAIPIFCDIDPETFVMDVPKVETLISERTRAVVAVHLGGNPVDMELLCNIAAKHRLAVVEDCAHAAGSRFRSRRVGNWGDAGTFSFQASKILTAGEGGAIVCNDEQLVRQMYSLSDCGRHTGAYFYEHYRHGSNYRMSEFNAAVLRAQLKRFPEQHRIRNANARYLAERLNAVPGIRVMKPTPGTEEIGYYVYPFLFDPAEFSGITNEEFRRGLDKAGIPTVDCYPPLHRLICFRERNLRKGIDYSRANWGGRLSDDSRFPVVSDVYARSIQLPHELLLADQQYLDRVSSAIEELRIEKKP